MRVKFLAQGNNRGLWWGSNSWLTGIHRSRVRRAIHCSFGYCWKDCVKNDDSKTNHSICFLSLGQFSIFGSNFYFCVVFYLWVNYLSLGQLCILWPNFYLWVNHHRTENFSIPLFRDLSEQYCITKRSKLHQCCIPHLVLCCY